MLEQLRASAQYAGIASTVGTPIAVAYIIVSEAGWDINTAVALIRVSDPIRIAFVALLTMAALVYFVPALLTAFDGDVLRLHEMKNWWIAVVSIAAPSLLTWWLLGFTMAVLIAGAIMAGLSFKFMLDSGSWRSDRGWTFTFFTTGAVMALSAISPYPEATVYFEGQTTPSDVRIVATEQGGIWLLRDVNGKTRLEWTDTEATRIVVCTRKDDPCDTEAPSPEPSADSPSSTSSPSPAAG